MYLPLRGGGKVKPEMSLAAGGLIDQAILRDDHDPTKWEPSCSLIFNIQILNSERFEKVTGEAPPPTPVAAAEYAKNGLPYFSIYDEKQSGVKGVFDGIRSVNQFDQTGVPSQEKTRASEDVLVDTYNPIVLLDVSGKRRGFRTVKDMEKDVRKHFDNMLV